MKKLKLKDVYSLREWMPFSDFEISTFQLYFIDYLKDNEEKLSKMDCFNLAVLASQTQYQMRLLKANIGGDKSELVSQAYLKSLMSFNGLIDYVTNKFLEQYERVDDMQRYHYHSNVLYSYFTALTEEKDKIKQDFDKFFGKK